MLFWLGGRAAPAALVALAGLTAVPAPSLAEPAPARQAVKFAKGTSSASLSGTIKGGADLDHTLDARAGQTLTVRLQSPNPSLYFNLNPPGSANAAMVIGTLQGGQAKVTLPTDGTYVVRVYLMRNAARRHEQARYTLDVAVTGQALPPLAAPRDALVAGTAFHATAPLACQVLGKDAGAPCQAGVIRRGRDGTATVELRSPNGLLRRVLFVKGQAVASDSPQPMTADRQGDLTTVRFGDDERYELPDALLTGG